MTVSSETGHFVRGAVYPRRVRTKLAILVAAVLAVAVLIGFYVGFLTGGPTAL